MQHNVETPFRINIIMVYFITITVLLILHYTEHRAGGE